MKNDWIEHRRGGDGELIGWMQPTENEFIVVDLLGRQRTEPVDWLTAEETLDGLGLAYLADPYELRLDSGSWLRVRLTEVSTDGVRVKKDDWGDVNAPELYYSVPFPADENLLRPLGERA